jgi:flagellar basal body-associated protein FliL
MMMMNKKANALVWIIILGVLITLGLVIYFWTSGTSAVSQLPQPPALPA